MSKISLPGLLCLLLGAGLIASLLTHPEISDDKDVDFMYNESIETAKTQRLFWELHYQELEQIVSDHEKEVAELEDRLEKCGCH